MTSRLAFVLPALVLFLAGCSTYQTPASGVALGALARGDADIAAVMAREPAAEFPARLAIVRVQDASYVRTSGYCHGQGAYCVITARDIERDEDIERLGRLPMITGVAPMSRLLLPARSDSLDELRLAAAPLRTDFLLVYSLDTRFSVQETDIGPLAVVSLGFLPNQRAHVTTTASAVLIDVRTGFLYGLAEATAREDQRATVWSSRGAIENARRQTEAESFRLLLDEFETLWVGVVEAHAAMEG